tara:strand:- start:394 stop:1500 length:1107 start_codon:yes stop_codon:yes gene_type:complete
MNSNLKLIFFIAVILSSIFFILGVGVGVYKWFPYQFLLKAKQILIQDKNSNFGKITSIDMNYINVHTKSINTANVFLKRKELIKKVILEANTLKVIKKEINENSEKITTKIYNNEINAILTYASKSNNCLRIYIQGHGGNPFFYSYHNELLEYFLNEGCDFLSMSMTGLGLNDGIFSYPSRYGTIDLDADMSKIHKNYSFFYDVNNPNLDPLTLFLTPHYKIIKYLESNYKDISVMGISGGGWYTVWLGALIPKIKLSISYAGSLPIEYRKFEGVSGDWEQQDSQIYNYITYWELYKLMTIDKNKKTSRKAILIYNDKDNCCFFNPYADHFKSILDKLNWKNLNVIIDENNKHVINVELIKQLYQSTN